MDAYKWFRRSVSNLNKASLPSVAAASSASKSSENKLQPQEEDKIYGITEKLIELVKSFSIDTFRNFALPDEEESGSDVGKSGNVRMDLSDWQETHAILVLSRVKELAQLRFQLCPRYLKEKQFWRIYFTLVRSLVVEYDLHAVRVAMLKQIRSESETLSNSSACEVEMSDTKLVPPSDSATSVE
ncbi:uncharacterized protein LOC121794480 [Salvia splendens]|uniref:uncharacterized protein LOC121794480 n=1 Tax=Salvia splendens TaxID=180675 RepID=UPI001C25BB49|nr:uncharacterized protein LOC121794480 [Salvia splendens]